MNAILSAAGLSPAILAQIFTGLAVFLAIIAFMPGGGPAKIVKSRILAVKDRQEALRARHRIKDNKKKKGQIDESTIKLMRNTIERFRMQDMVENTELRMKLARAGFRGQKAPITFLFFRIVAPILMGLGCILYFGVFYAGEFDPKRHTMIAGMITFGGFALPNIVLKNMTQKREIKLHRAFPDALDLTVICVESGMSIEKAFHKVADEIAQQGPELAGEIALTNAELSYMGDRGQAYENFAKRTGMQQIKALTSALIQAERYGTPIASALRVLSEESRDERMSMAERKAAALPAKLTVPMIVFFLPVLFIVIIGPAAIQVMAG